MHRLLVLYPPRWAPDHFQTSSEDTPLPLAAKFPGLRAYRYSFDVAAAEGESPYYCVFEADFDDAAALSAARASPRVRQCARTSRTTPPAASSCWTTNSAPTEPRLRGNRPCPCAPRPAPNRPGDQRDDSLSHPPERSGQAGATRAAPFASKR